MYLLIHYDNVDPNDLRFGLGALTLDGSPLPGSIPRLTVPTAAGAATGTLPAGGAMVIR